MFNSSKLTVAQIQWYNGIFIFIYLTKMRYNQYNYEKEFLKYIKHINKTDKTVIFSNFIIVFAAPDHSKKLLKLHK